MGADPQYFAHAGVLAHHAVAAPLAHAVAAPVAVAPAPLPVAHAVAHSVTVTKVTCADVENKLPKTTCEAVVTSATSHAAYAAPLPVAHHVAPVGYAYGH